MISIEVDVIVHPVLSIIYLFKQFDDRNNNYYYYYYELTSTNTDGRIRIL